MYNPFRALREGKKLELLPEVTNGQAGVGTSIYANPRKIGDTEITFLSTDGSYFPTGGKKILVCPGHSIVLLLPNEPGHADWLKAFPDLEVFFVKVKGSNYPEALVVNPDNLLGHGKFTEATLGKIDTISAELTFFDASTRKVRVVPLTPEQLAQRKGNPAFATLYLSRRDYDELAGTPYTNLAARSPLLTENAGKLITDDDEELSQEDKKNLTNAW